MTNRRTPESLPLDYAPRGWKPPPRRLPQDFVSPDDRDFLLDEDGIRLLDEDGEFLLGE